MLSLCLPLGDLPFEFLPESRVRLAPIRAPSLHKDPLDLFQEALPGRAVFVSQDVLQEWDQAVEQASFGRYALAPSSIDFLRASGEKAWAVRITVGTGLMRRTSASGGRSPGRPSRPG